MLTRETFGYRPHAKLEAIVFLEVVEAEVQLGGRPTSETENTACKSIEFSINWRGSANTLRLFTFSMCFGISRGVRSSFRDCGGWALCGLGRYIS
jgi:hypothetical protein